MKLSYDEFNKYLVDKYNLPRYFRRSDPSERAHFKLILPILKRLPDSTMFADIGCGDLSLGYILTREGILNYVALDRSLRNLCVSKEVQDMFKLPTNLILGDMWHQPFRDGIFDSVCIFQVLVNVPFPKHLKPNYLLNVVRVGGEILFDIHTEDVGNDRVLVYPVNDVRRWTKFQTQFIRIPKTPKHVVRIIKSTTQVLDKKENFLERIASRLTNPNPNR